MMAGNRIKGSAVQTFYSNTKIRTSENSHDKTKINLTFCAHANLRTVSAFILYVNSETLCYLCVRCVFIDFSFFCSSASSTDNELGIQIRRNRSLQKTLWIVVCA